MLLSNNNNLQIKLTLVQSIVPCLVLFIFSMIFLFNCFDLSDESYYLFNITNPWGYDNTSTQFGFIYYFLFKILDHNIPLFRIVQFIFILTINGFLAYIFIKNFLEESFKTFKNINFALSILLSFISLMIYSLWLPTPNYNLLNYSALSLTTIGVLLMVFNHKKKNKIENANKNKIGNINKNDNINENRNEKTKLSQSWISWIIIAIGGYLCFMAKPQSGVGLAILVLLFAFYSKNFTVKNIFIPAIISFVLLLISAIILDGSLTLFIHRYLKALEGEKIVKVHVGIFYFNINLPFLKHIVNFRYILSFFLLLFWGFSLAYLSEKSNTKLWFSFITLTFLFFIIYIFFIFKPTPLGYVRGPWLWGTPLGVILYEIITGTKGLRYPTKNQIGWAIFFIVLSFIYAVGSNNPIIITITLSSFFIFLSLLVLLRRNTVSLLYKLIGIILLSQFLLISLIYSAWHFPYRNTGPVWEANIPVSIPLGEHKIKLSKEQAQFYISLYEIVDKQNFEANTPVIDLTGQFPGLLYAIGGNLPNVSWLGSKYEGAQKSALYVLQKLSCEDLARSWVLMSNFPLQFQFDPEILKKAGLDYNDHYDLAGELKIPFLAQRNNIAYFDIVFLRPNINWKNQIKVCEANRKSSSLT